jgi:hypothetical protein
MIVEYDVHCHERTLTIKFPNGYENLKEEILKMLDDYYSEWQDATDPFITDIPLEEYMMDRLSETYNMWEEWDSIYYGDDEAEMYETIPVKNERRFKDEN